MGMVAMIRRNLVYPGFRRGLLFKRGVIPAHPLATSKKPGREGLPAGLTVMETEGSVPSAKTRSLSR